MRRREFIAAIGGAVALPLVARAQQQALPVIGYLNGLSAVDRPHHTEAFRKGLSETGYIEGRNVEIEYRYGDNRVERLHEHAAELVSRKVMVIVATGGNNPGLVAKAATSSIPILFTSGVDPVKAGLVASLGRPEGNVTGVSWFATDLPPKHIELLSEILPRVAVIGFIVNPKNPEWTASEAVARQAASASKVRLVVLNASTPNEIDAAFDLLVRNGVDAAIVGGDPFFNARATQFGALGIRHRIPVAYPNRDQAEGGGLVSYGNSVSDAYRRVGILAGRVLKGAKPADLPVDRAVKFELVVNLKAAKALGLTLPHSLLSRADEVID